MNFFKEVTLKKVKHKERVNKTHQMTYSLNLCSFDKVDDKKIIR